jgi:hypothetical protein
MGPVIKNCGLLANKKAGNYCRPFLIRRLDMNLPRAGAIVCSIFTAACCLAGPVSPETISEEARAFLKIAVPADMSQAETVEDWQRMRTEIS